MEDVVLEYEKEPIEAWKIVFYGPSTFTRWSSKYGMRPLSDSLIATSIVAIYANIMLQRGMI
jgi:hypothetical protein